MKSRLSLHKARQFICASGLRKFYFAVAAFLLIALIVSVVGNIVQLRNAETVRRQHVWMVQSQLGDLYWTVRRTADAELTCEPFSERRRIWTETLFTSVRVSQMAVWGLSAHHDWSFGTAFPDNLTMILQIVTRYNENPSDSLHLIADKLYELLEILQPDMPTRDMFDAMNATSAEINSAFPRYR